MRKKVVEKCEYFQQKHEMSQQVTLLSSYQLTVKYVQLLACDEWYFTYENYFTFSCIYNNNNMSSPKLFGKSVSLSLSLPLTISCSSKSRLLLPFWCWLTWVVPKGH